MAQKLNCWDFKLCHEKDCPARSEKKLHEVHGGVNAGRSCWVVAGTRCGGVVQGEFAKKEGNCMQCDFYLKVRSEEGMNMKNGAVLQSMLA